MTQTRILFICHGNICRSPAAEMVFRQLLEQNSLQDRAEAARAFVSPLDEGPVDADLAFEQCVGVLRRQRMDAQINELMEALHQETDPAKKNAQMDMLRQLTLERARI